MVQALRYVNHTENRRDGVHAVGADDEVETGTVAAGGHGEAEVAAPVVKEVRELEVRAVPDHARLTGAIDGGALSPVRGRPL